MLFWLHAERAAAVEAPGLVQIVLAFFACLSRVNVRDGEFFAWEDCTEGVNVLGKSFGVKVVVGVRAAIMIQTL
jgi:hypothetical protein